MNARLILVSFAIAALAAIALAGPLNPPAGTVTPSYKTLAEVEPRIAINATNTPGDADSMFKISSPGSYYLTGNVQGVTGKHGIKIASDHVTLDLNGFTLFGTPGMGAYDGVVVVAGGPRTDTTVRNGMVQGWGLHGIDLATQGTTNGAVLDVQASHNLGRGIAVGSGYLVTRCEAYSNGDRGISTSLVSTVTDCVSFLNVGNGITVNTGSTISHCTVRGNSADGINVSDECMVLANTTTINDGAGIHATGSNNRIEGNNCTSSARGIDIDSAGNFIIKNTCRSNTTNWTVVAGNACYVVSATTGPAINGNNGGFGLGTTDPNANFTY